LQLPSSKTSVRGRQRVENISLQPIRNADAERKIKSWYSKELKNLSTINASISTLLAGEAEDATQVADHDAAQDAAEPEDKGSAIAISSATTGCKNGSFSISTMLDSSLDPFVGLATDVTPRQQGLLQFCMELHHLRGKATLTIAVIRDFAPTMFGTSETAFYSPSQAVGLPAVGHSKVGTQWICILADEIIHAMSGRERSQELSRQRSNGYVNLKTALRRREDKFEEALLGIVIAGLVEYSFGDTRAQSLHTIAADMLIHSRGGMENTIKAAPNLEPFYIHAQYAFGRCRIPSLDNFENITTEWLEELERILETNRSTWRKCGGTPDRHAACQCVILEQATVQRAMESLAVKDPSAFAVGMQLTLLVEITSALMEFAGRCSLAVKYFRRIAFICRHSMIDSGGKAETCELRAGTLASICSRARRDVIGQDIPDELLDSDTRIVKRHIVALKPFGYLTSKSQNLVLDRMISWLRQGGRRSVSLGEGQFNLLKAEAIQTWYSCYGSRA